MMLFWLVFGILMACGLVFSLRMQKKIQARLKDEAKDSASKDDE